MLTIFIMQGGVLHIIIFGMNDERTVGIHGCRLSDHVTRLSRLTYMIFRHVHEGIPFLCFNLSLTSTVILM